MILKTENHQGVCPGKENLRVATYSRCSTKKQDLESANKTLSNWAKEFKEHLHYEDLSISGRKDDRKGINRLLEDAREGKFDLVGIVELSRIGRSISFIHKTIEELSKLGIKVVLVNSGAILDYKSLEGRALIGGLSLASDIEWMLISERNERGRQKVREKGIRVGRRKQEVSIEVIKALQEKGMSLRKIAKEFGVSAATISRRVRV